MPIYYDGNDNTITLTGLQNAVSGNYLNSATVTVTVVDSDGNEVSGQTWPTTMSYVSGSDGNYRGTLQDAMVTTASELLTAQVTADGGAGQRGYWEEPLIVLTRV